VKSKPAQRDLNVDGRPELVLSNEEREALAELLAELLLEALGAAVPAGAAS
jgi:hypothetical protein